MSSDAQHPYGQPASPYSQPYPAPQGPAYASWGQRVLATLIDSAVVAFVPWLFFIFALVTSEVTEHAFREPTSEPSGPGYVALVVGSVLYVALWFWNRIHRQGTTGQSVGKKVLGIRLVSQTTGQPVGRGTVFLREIAHVADAPLYLGYLWPLWDTQRQTFADKIMTTVVVREGNR